MCRELSDQGISVALATTDAGMSHEVAIRNTIVDYKRIPTIFFESQWGHSFKFSRPMAVWLDENVRRFDVVHIHAVFNHACVAAARACHKHGVPYVVRPLGSLDPWSMNQKRLRKQLFWQLRGEKMLRGAAAVHYTTSAEREAVERTLGLSNGAVISLAIESRHAEPQSPGFDISRVLPQLNGHPYVLVLSRLHPKKAIDVLIDAFVGATNNGDLKNWRLVIAGDGPDDYGRRLRQQVDAANAQERVLFPGWLEGDDKRDILSRAALLALPSYQENFGLCVVEALNCGVPVLVSPHVNLADDIQKSDAGWICSVEQTALQATLIEVLGNADERAKRGSAALTLSKQFTWNNTAKDLIRLYSSVVRSHVDELNAVTN